jgi:hypothetical protein
VEVLDFYHASEHVWALGRSLKGEEQAKEWVEPLLHQLRHGKEKKALGTIASASAPKRERGQILRREKNYFERQHHRMNYGQIARGSCTIA